MLAVDGLQAWYGRTQALFGVSFEVEVGQTLGLIGANGAGKSTVIRGMIGAIRTRGTVRISGSDCSHVPTHRRVKEHGIAVLHEGRGLFQRMTVRDNLLAGLSLSKSQSIDLVTDLFPEIADRMDVAVSNLSGGEQQMVALGRCVLRQPRLLLLDEPSLGLAPTLVDRIYDALNQMRTAGMSIVVVEQDIPRVVRFADRLCHIHMGAAVANVEADDSEGVNEITRVILGQTAAGASNAAVQANDQNNLPPTRG